MAYTTIDNPSEHFQPVLFTGSTSNITVDIDMRPDFFWFKSRTQTYSHLLYDTSRPSDGTSMPSGDVNMYNFLTSNTTAAEDDNNADGLVQTSTGFIVDGDGQAIGEAGQGANNMAVWCWKANGGTTTTNDASSTGVGSIDSVYQANTTAGFSIVTYTGAASGSTGFTIAHGLGVVPKLIIVKNRDSTYPWEVFHGFERGDGARHYGVSLDDTHVQNNSDTYWNDTNPTSTVFSVRESDTTNKNGDKFVAYCFSEIQGYSKFGGYTGNGNADGPFIYTGFKPAWLLIKRVDGGTGTWLLSDNQRDPINATNKILKPNVNNVENTGYWYVDYLSNGFKVRLTDAEINGNGHTMIYMAFAEHPFVSSEGVPTTAR